MTTHDVAPTVIPIPSDFPVTWANPEDETLQLAQNRQHAPIPITPLTGWIGETHLGKGSSAGFAAAGQPIAMLFRTFNTYSYFAVVPSVPDEQMEEAGQRAEEMLRASIPSFGKRWDEEWLPEVQGYHEIWENFDLPGASANELLAHVEWTLKTYERFWDIHFEVGVPFLVAPSMFQDLYEDLFGKSEALVAYKLLQGIENASIVAIRELWSLARSADSETRRLILDTPTADLVTALPSSSSGAGFLARLRSYLNQYGKRSDGVIEFADPSWVEDPTIAINNVKAYLSDGAEDPGTHWRQLVAERECYVDEARKKLADYPDAIRDRFEMLLAAGQNGHRIQEDHNWWIDQMGNHQVRQVYLECGRRLASAGAVNARDDVFYLTGDEITRTIASESPANFENIVRERKDEMARWDKVQAPLVIGTDYGPPPDNPVTTALGRFFGGPPPAPDPERPDVVLGTPGSPGTVTGTARVIKKLSESGRLGVGEILVTVTTAPPWTPLFATAGGIVTDTGGPLSHCAIVAREYGLPAVVGTGMATAVIQDGQQIEVNGDIGEVRIL